MKLHSINVLIKMLGLKPISIFFKSGFGFKPKTFFLLKPILKKVSTSDKIFIYKLLFT